VIIQPEGGEVMNNLLPVFFYQYEIEMVKGMATRHRSRRDYRQQALKVTNSRHGFNQRRLYCECLSKGFPLLTKVVCLAWFHLFIYELVPSRHWELCGLLNLC